MRHIFIFIFVFSVFSLTLQASIISICKDSKVFKSQNQTNPVTEEEEESHDSDEDSVYYLGYENDFDKSHLINETSWCKKVYGYPAYTKSIPIPPPKF